MVIDHVVQECLKGGLAQRAGANDGSPLQNAAQAKGVQAVVRVGFLLIGPEADGTGIFLVPFSSSFFPFASCFLFGSALGATMIFRSARRQRLAQTVWRSTRHGCGGPSLRQAAQSRRGHESTALKVFSLQRHHARRHMGVGEASNSLGSLVVGHGDTRQDKPRTAQEGSSNLGAVGGTDTSCFSLPVCKVQSSVTQTALRQPHACNTLAGGHTLVLFGKSLACTNALVFGEFRCQKRREMITKMRKMINCFVETSGKKNVLVSY
jgi:hypothetical protein